LRARATKRDRSARLTVVGAVTSDAVEPVGEVDDLGRGTVELVQAVNTSVMATAAITTSLRTMRIIAPTVSSAGSRTTPGRDDNGYVPIAAEFGMRTLADGTTD
jgi:hypothetical protein